MDIKKLPELIESVRAEAHDSLVFNPFFGAGVLRMEYGYDGRTFEQDIICAIMVVNTYSSILWYADKIFLLRLVEGRLDQNCRLSGDIIKSFKI